jgi:hypothetical protein
MSHDMGARLGKAIATKDRAGLLDVLAPELDFRAMTPSKFWEAQTASEVVDEVVLGKWFEPTDHIDALDDLQTSTVADRDRVAYRLRVSNEEGTFLVEQQAYFAVEDDRITWLRIMCSGYRPVDG